MAEPSPWGATPNPALRAAKRTAKKAAPRRKYDRTNKQATEWIVAQGASTASFLVEVDGKAIGRFSEVSGLQVQLEMETFNEGGLNGYAHQLPGKLTWPNLVLKRGITQDDALMDWFNRCAGATFVSQGKVDRGTAAVSVINGDGERLRSWKLIRALPVRWSGPTLAVSSDDQLTEELEVAHEGFDVESFSPPLPKPKPKPKPTGKK